VKVKVPGIPDPQADPESLRQTVLSLKEGVEVLSGQRGGPLNAAVTWQDLVDLGLVTPARVPRR